MAHPAELEPPPTEAGMPSRTSEPAPRTHHDEPGASGTDHSSTPQAASPATSSEPTPQLALDFSPRPEPSAPEQTIPPSVPPIAGDLHTLIGPIVRLLGEVVGEAVRQSVDAAVGQMQQVHAREREDLAQRFEAALDRQDARLKSTLEQQARQHTEELRTLAAEVSRPAAAASSGETTAILEELQETLRLGFGEVRGALDRHHHEFMSILRAELRPLAQAATTHLRASTSETAASSANPPAPDEPTPTPPARASPVRPRPAPDARASSQRLNAAIQDDDNDDAIEDPEDHHRRPPRCRGPDIDDVSHHQAAHP